MSKHDSVLSPAQVQQAIKLYAEGVGGETIARDLGVTRQAIYYHLRKRGIERREAVWLDDANPFWRGGKMHEPRITKIVVGAIKAGILKRPECCSCCGKEVKFKNGKSAIHAHHDDYNKPLEVHWLCLPCHHEWHKANRAIPLRG